MASLSATWSRLATSSRLQRSSHTLSVVGSNVWIFGGELQPRWPVDNQLDVIAVDDSEGELPTDHEAVAIKSDAVINR